MKNKETQKDTKVRILEVAEILFSKKGFHGTSIRDIAAEAHVNSAAINYHFRDKLSLYMDILDSAHERVMQEMQRQIKSNPNIRTHEAVRWIFHLLYDDRQKLMNCFRLMNSSVFADGLVLRPDFEKKLTFFPTEPYLAGLIKNESKSSISLALATKLAKIINEYIFHLILMLGYPLGEDLQSKLEISKEPMLERLALLVDVVLSQNLVE